MNLAGCPVPWQQFGDSAGEVSARTRQKLAAEVQIGLPLVRRRADEVSEAVTAGVDSVANELADQGCDEDALTKLSRTIRDRTGAVARTVATGR